MTGEKVNWLSKFRPFIRTVFPFAVIWCALVEIAELVAKLKFGMELDGDWYLLVLGSSAAAMAAFFRLYWLPLLVSAGAFLLLVSAVTVLSLRAPWRTFRVVLAVFAAYVVWNCRTPSEAKAWKPVYVAYDTVRGIGRYSAIVKAGTWTPERAAAVRPAPEGATNVVFVIGESTTTDRLSFFGYKRETTPRLRALGDRLEVKGPYRAWSPYTVTSLTSMFITNGISAAAAYRMAGYRTVSISSHPRWTRYCSVEYSVFASCERSIYLSEEHKGERIYDDMLLPYVKDQLAGTQPFVLFVHLIGSHFDPADRVRPEYLAGSGLDDFDRSVRFTDEVLSAIIGMLPPRTVLVFMSDHGESTDCPGWRNFSSPALWSIPLMIYPAGSPLPYGLNVQEWHNKADSVFHSI